MRKGLRTLKGHVGRIMRDIQRRLGTVAEAELRARIECISKGKARKRYEFGSKVSIATTHEEGFVLAMRSMPGNPYDGHTLEEALEQVEILTDARPKRAFADKRYRGHGVETTDVYLSGQKRGVSKALRKALRRTSAIEPMIGHMKTDGRLARRPSREKSATPFTPSSAAQATTSASSSPD